MIDNAKEFIIGMCLSAITWETFENLLVAMAVAFVGGMMGAAGKHAHKCFMDWKAKKRQDGQH